MSDGDASFWEPSRDLGGKRFGGFTPPTGAGGTNDDAGASGGTGPGGNSGTGGDAGAAGGGVGGNSGVSGVGGSSAGSGGEAGTSGGDGPGGTGPGGTGPGGTGPGGTGGTGAGGSGPSTACALTFDVTTVSYRGRFSPKNIGAVWVMNSQNQFVKTLEVWAGIRANNLVNWQRQAAGNRVDAVTAATISNHRAHQTRWDCKDARGAVVPNGQYRMVVEFTEDDSALFFNPQPKSFSFDFQKGAGPQTLSPPAQPNFTSMAFSIQ